MTDSAALGHEIHVWSASIAANAIEEPRFWTLLDSGERLKAERFRFARDRTTYVVAHGLLRTLLGRYLRQLPDSLRFVIGSWGKPALEPPSGSGLAFNLSHSGDYVFVALTRDRAVGVDVERWNPDIEFDQLASVCFSPAERAELGALAPELKEHGFHAGWTRKEAYIKALGVGVSQGLDYFDVSLDPAVPARIVEDRLTAGNALRWRLADLPMEFGYSAAVCAEGPDWTLRCFQGASAAGWAGQGMTR